MTNKTTRDRWKTRRRMAWGAFGFAVAMILSLYAMDKDWITAASGIIIAALTFCGGIITVYIGYATQDDIKNKNRGE